MKVFSLVCLALAGAFAADYNEPLAKLMSQMASIAHSDTPENCLNSLTGMELTKVYNTDCADSFDATTCSSFIAVDTANKAVALVFRATHLSLVDDLSDEEREIGVGKAVWFPRENEPETTGGYVYNYWYQVFYQMWDLGLQNELELLHTQYGDFKLYVTGHSLGGSLASMAVATIGAQNIWQKDLITFYTLGEPRTGDINFAEYVHSLVDSPYRVVNQRDPVTHTPFCKKASIFDPTCVPENKRPYHHGVEIWYENGSDEPYQTCTNENPKWESVDCSNGLLFPANPVDHNNYVGISQLTYFQQCREPSPSAQQVKNVRKGFTYDGESKPHPFTVITY